MQVDFLIIGQGICGSFLSLELKKANRSFLVIDDERKFSASRVASGIINPVTGRRIVTTWMIDELLPFAKDAYTHFGQLASVDIISEKTTLDFFPTPQMLIAFKKRVEEGAIYLQMPPEDPLWRTRINYDFGYGTIHPCLLVDLSVFLSKARESLKASNHLLTEKFEQEALELLPGASKYKDIIAQKIIYCDGIYSMNNPFFSLLPFAPNKGELLIADIPDLPRDFIYKYGISIVPWKENLFWIGASNEWTFENDLPTENFRERTAAQLKKILKLPFTIVDHLAAVRPATLERRPFVGLHPIHRQVGIFNGMGTKGCSLAPYFAKQFADLLLHEQPLLPEVDVNRFKNILSR